MTEQKNHGLYLHQRSLCSGSEYLSLTAYSINRQRTMFIVFCRFSIFYVGTGVPDGPKSLLLEEKALAWEGERG